MAWTHSLTSRYLFFTGKGGVGKTSLACSTALHLADSGRRVLLISTDPASNLDEVLGQALTPEPQLLQSVPGLWAANLDPEAAAAAYREKAVGPFRDKLPPAVIRNMEEQFSGACTTELAAFDQFVELLAKYGPNPKPAVGAEPLHSGENLAGPYLAQPNERPVRYAELAGDRDEFDHVVFDTAPTGHTLRLLSLPGAWSDYLNTTTAETSCLGPLAALKEKRSLYALALERLRDGGQTTLVLVARPELSSLREAARSAGELSELGIRNVQLLVNGVLRSGSGDAVAAAICEQQNRALAHLPATTPRQFIPLLPQNLVGLAALRALSQPAAAVAVPGDLAEIPGGLQNLDQLVDELLLQPSGVVMTMGKGGVGKTSVAIEIAQRLSLRGVRVRLTTTDPAGDLVERVTPSAQLSVDRIDPAQELKRYRASVLNKAGATLDAEGLALLEEDLRSPCTEEIAVFQAFAKALQPGVADFVVIDTAPTGHTILLMDATQAYHREVSRSQGGSEAVRQLLPRLRDANYTRVVLVTLPEPTPLHEAQSLQADLLRAGIQTFAWVVNRSLLASGTRDPILATRAHHEQRCLAELLALGQRTVLEPMHTEFVSANSEGILSATTRGPRSGTTDIPLISKAGV